MVRLRGREHYPIYFGAGIEIIKRARELRLNVTPQEEILWNQLRNRKLEGFKFRRQHPIGKFIVDFFCYEKMLIVEIDGSVHNVKFQSECDQGRTSILEGLGIRVIRFSNEEIEKDLNSVIDKIRKELTF